jgi:hypothetical protein
MPHADGFVETAATGNEVPRKDARHYFVGQTA